MTIAPETIAPPQMEEVHYGVGVAHVGFEGDLIALGHPGVRRAFAAFNRHARVYVGLENLLDDRTATCGNWREAITEQWVIFRKHLPADDYEGRDFDWYFDACSKDEPGAQPVTLLDLQRL